MGLKALTEKDLDDEQRRIWKDLAEGPRAQVRGVRAPDGPFTVLLQSPELADRVQKVGQVVRLHSHLPRKILEFAIIITARRWNTSHVWGHHKYALQAGLSPAIVDDLRHGREPCGMQSDEAACYAFCTELHAARDVSDAVCAEAVRHFGEPGVVDLTTTCGYYATLCMVLNVSRKPLAAGKETLPAL